MAEVERKPWSKEACEKCGEVGYVSRGEPTDKPYVCGECEMYGRGYEDGHAAGTVEAANVCRDRMKKIDEATESLIEVFSEFRKLVRSLAEIPDP